MKMRKVTVLTIALTFVLIACNQTPTARNSDNVPNNALTSGCTGDTVTLPSQGVACIYKQEIVIETGFSCPAEFANRFDFQTFSACDPRVDLPRIDLDFLNFRDLRAWPDNPWDLAETPTTLPLTQEVDILWVIDNSGSMCEEQKMLREGFVRFVESLQSKGIDFQIGVTTTQVKDDWELEPLARRGELQSQPQPIPGFDPSCRTARDEAGQRILGDYRPIRDTIDLAVSCMQNPDPSYLEVTDDEIACGLGISDTQGCTIARAGCGGQGSDCTEEDLFPPTTAYRVIPKVLRRQDYLQGDTLDTTRLIADFACASMVGTRGYGIEQGLLAAIEAVSPSKTGAGQPNEGFIRPDARFAVFFLTDENDCSHDGTLDDTSTCGGDVCEFATITPNSPLIPIDGLRNELIQNLGSTKGRVVDPREIAVGSLHGKSVQFQGPIPSESQCEQGEFAVMPTCASSLGMAYSGLRYEQFLRSFPQGNQFPYARNTSEEITGWMCDGNFVPALSGAGDFLSAFVGD